MARLLTLELPWPPSVNRYWRRSGERILVSREGRRYREEVRAWLPGAIEPLEGDLAVDVALYPPDSRRRDVDNSLKALLDALEYAGVYADDSQVVRLCVERLEPVPEGRVVVEIREEASGDASP